MSGAQFVSDDSLGNPQNAGVLIMTNSFQSWFLVYITVLNRLSLHTLCECALCYWAAEMLSGRR